MDASLPPYAHLGQAEVACVASTAARYQVPELLLHAVLLKENGRAGACSTNSNGSQDCGLAQINTIWAPYFQRQGVPWGAIRDDTCVSIQAAAYVLRKQQPAVGGGWFESIVAYNIGPYNWNPVRYQVGHAYASDVVKTWRFLQDWVEKNRGTR